jgi:hypothetical protein
LSVAIDGDHDHAVAARFHLPMPEAEAVEACDHAG